MSQEHLLPWWGTEADDIAGVGDDAPTLERVEERYGPELDDERTLHFVIVADGEPVGMIQTYLVASYPEYGEYLGSDEGAAIDLLIGDPARIGRGLGPQVIRSFTRDVVFAAYAVDLCLASPDERNERSLRAFEKAGYTRGAALVARHVGELREVVEERQPRRTGGPVAVLRHDHLGRAALIRLRVVDLVAVQEHHDVRVLLD
jgi:RimJ/RimL family protein N-acetyltransferase